MKNHKFPLIDRNGQRVILQRTGEEGIIVHRGTCAYWVEFSDRCEVRSTYELDYLDEPEPAQQRVGKARMTQLSLFEQQSPRSH
ncbi:hypothetical protein NDI45_12780 [Leptolyngbya sp. GB1-A1]|uniref:hypothetical protein n=1 Tax=Leptolyngbya sp. GB1-A1 TaxID=2933908 RepID=UPI0032994691